MEKKLIKLSPLVLIGLGVLLFVSSLLSVLQSENGDVTMTGIKAIFGGNVASFGNFFSADVRFSFLNLLAFYLPLFAALGLFFFNKQSKREKMGTLIFSVFVLLSFLLSVIVISNLGMHTYGHATFLGDFVYEGAYLSIGAISGIIISSLGLIVSLIYTLLLIK